MDHPTIRPSDHATTKQMRMWTHILEHVKNANDRPDGEHVCLAVDGAGLDNIKHWDRFLVMFKAMKDKPFCVLTTRGGTIYHKFRGEKQYEPCEVIGVPKYDAIFYISEQGRVSTTGGNSIYALFEKMGGMTPIMSGRKPDSEY